MKKRHLVAINLINLLVIASYIECIQLDNELVSKPQHCFERIALGAMLPFDKTFRKTDTNVLDKCLNLCLSDVECVTFSFGISARGNGTCQLSSKVIDSTGSSPVGTIFDPDFDLYARKTSNCLVDPMPNRGQVPRPGGFDKNPGSDNGNTNLPPSRPTQGSFPPTENTGRPGSTVFVSPSSSGTYSTDGSDGSSSPGDFSTTPFGGSSIPDPSSNTRPSSQSTDELYNINNKFPTTYPTSNRNPQTSSQPDAAPPTRPIDTTHPPESNHPQPPPPRPIEPERQPLHPERPNNQHPYPIGPDPFPDYFPHIHPHYHYDHDYTDNKDSHFPGIYAHNSPSLHDRYYPQAPQAPINHNDYGSGGLYASGRYPDSDMHYLGHAGGGYNANRKNGYQVTDNSPDIPMSKPCFRRVLAGKRVATHWVRRTLICERLEDCQQQCGDEKRFSCEGFNYRLDPSGRGQGECELVEVPLSRMDLYSSPHNRDSNLIPHPDYDYYERDRSSANCRASPCIDCGLNPGYIKPTTYRPPSNYKPSHENDKDRYGPSSTAVDKYRPQNNFYENRPDSWDRYGGSNYFAAGGEQHYNRPSSFPDSRPPSSYPESRPPAGYPDSRPPSGYPDSRPPPSFPDSRPPSSYPDSRPPSNYPDSRPPYGSNIDRYGSVDGGGSDYHYKPSPHRPAPLNPSSGGGYVDPYNERPHQPSRPSLPDSDYNRPPSRPVIPDSDYNRPPPGVIPIKHPSDYDRPDAPYRPKPDLPPPQSGGYGGGLPPQSPPPRPGIGYLDRDPPPPPPPSYHHKGDYHPTNFHQKPSSGFVPYLIGQDNSWGMYGGTYGSSSGSISYRPQVDYWGLKNEIKRKDGPHFNYFELGPGEDNSVYRYGGPMGDRDRTPYSQYGGSQHGGSQHGGSQHGGSQYGGSQHGSSQHGGSQHGESPYGGSQHGGSEHGLSQHGGSYGGSHGSSQIGSYGGSQTGSYGGSNSGSHSGSEVDSHGGSYGSPQGGMDWGHMWTRRPGAEECSVKTSEGFRLHKGVVRNAFTVPNIGECEKMCYSEDKFRCSVFSYRYSDPSSNNCLLCDRSFSLLDSYADIVPDRGYDIYSMSDDMNVCKKDAASNRGDNSLASYGSASNNDQCFIRSIDTKRLYESIVRDSLTVRSIGECEIECVKAKTFTCRAFAFRYGSKVSGTIIDNCQLTDWPVRDMDKDRHLIEDKGFDTFERASYGKGCEIQPFEHDHGAHDKNQKLCYLGYGSAAKLVASAIKKVISVTSEVECKNECIRYRETSPFKCLSFSYGSQASSFNCEMSDLDQSELKVDVHYTHTPSRDYWLFAWNPFDYTCRDKITSISGNRINSERRMDIFRDSGGQRHLTVSGRACRSGTKCERNHISGFYSCEYEGGEIGAWDFCCREDHPCGFSRDFDYPWCYVGNDQEQWRSCSVSYTPIHTQQASYSSNSFVATRYPNKKHDIYQSPPRPGGLHSRELIHSEAAFESQLLPIQYLYHEGPPNATQISNNIIDCARERC